MTDNIIDLPIVKRNPTIADEFARFVVEACQPGSSAHALAALLAAIEIGSERIMRQTEAEAVAITTMDEFAKVAQAARAYKRAAGLVP